MRKVRRVFLVLIVGLVTVVVVEGGPGGCGSGEDDCCAVCTTGKACGDSCISTSDTCHVGAGCACNG
jgi:hypothetical protein